MASSFCWHGMRMSVLKNLLLLVLALTIGATTVRAVEHLGDIRIWDAPDHTRVVFDLSGSVRYHTFQLKNPDRLVIDFTNVRQRSIKRKKPVSTSIIRKLRYGHPKSGVLRVVLDLRGQVSAQTSLLSPSAKKPFRLVADLWPKAKKTAVKHTNSSAPPTARKNRKRSLVIAVDAGHGGEDPGAIGHGGLQEKRVTLSVAKALASLINKQPGMRAVLIRKGDYFVPLKKRVALVRRAKADLMISIHADSVSEKWVKGSSVYTISERGATQDKVAAALAARENASDLIGGVVPGHKLYNKMTQSVLGDMARQDAFNSSQLMAQQVLAEMKRVGVLKYSKPKRARFAVLGALEVPSVLVEMDYISNPSRERMLSSKKHQQSIAKALLKATRSFLRRMSMNITPAQLSS